MIRKLLLAALILTISAIGLDGSIVPTDVPAKRSVKV